MAKTHALFEVEEIRGSGLKFNDKFIGVSYPELTTYLDGEKKGLARGKLYTSWISAERLQRELLEKHRRCMIVLDAATWVRGDHDTPWMKGTPAYWRKLEGDDWGAWSVVGDDWGPWSVADWTDSEDSEDNLAEYMNPVRLTAEQQQREVLVPGGCVGPPSTGTPLSSSPPPSSCDISVVPEPRIPAGRGHFVRGAAYAIQHEFLDHGQHIFIVVAAINYSPPGALLFGNVQLGKTEALFEVTEIKGSNKKKTSNKKFWGFDYPLLRNGFLNGDDSPTAKKKLYTSCISQRMLRQEFTKKGLRCIMALDTKSWLRGDDDTCWMQGFCGHWVNLFEEESGEDRNRVRHRESGDWTEDEEEVAEYMKPATMSAEDQLELFPKQSSSSPLPSYCLPLRTSSTPSTSSSPRPGLNSSLSSPCSLNWTMEWLMSNHDINPPAKNYDCEYFGEENYYTAKIPKQHVQVHRRC